MAISPLTKFIVKRPWLHRWMMPISQWYMNATGHRKLGLRYEDLLPEENEATQLALKRLPPKEAYDRVFRLRRAFQVCRIGRLLGDHDDHADTVHHSSPFHIKSCHNPNGHDLKKYDLSVLE